MEKTLLSLPCKAYSGVLERRVRRIVNPRIQKEQCACEFAQPVHMCFVDLEKASDRAESCRGFSGIIGYPFIWAVHCPLWSPSPILSHTREVRVGLCQGCPLSSILMGTPWKHPEELDEVAGLLCSGCYHLDPTPDKLWRMDGWKDGELWLLCHNKNYYLGFGFCLWQVFSQLPK